MKKIKGSVDISMTFEEIVELNELIDRDTAKPMIQTDDESFAKCPTCGRYILIGSTTFCTDCGQRIDTENYAL